jgi:glutathione reductase (NADPH)
MAEFDVDLFTIGGGSGGVRASRVAASHGARVALAEEARLGGTCVNVGCIPKKLLTYAAHFRDDFEDAAGFGWTVGSSSFDWGRLIEAKDREIARLNGVYRRILETNGVRILEDRATVVGPHEVRVGDRTIRARHVLVATGSRPVITGEPGAELGINSNDFFHLPALPRRAVVVGGGYIAVECAGILHGLGSEVTLVHRGPLLLRGFDDDVRTVLLEEMRKRGLDVRLEERIARIDRAGARLRATLASGAEVETDVVLHACGRKPNTQGLGLEHVGVELAPDGAVVVDAFSRSSVPSIHAIGDVTNRVNLTPVAIHEAMALVATLFENRPTRPDHAGIPSAVFSQPPVGTVGLTEAEACASHGAVDVYKTRFRPLKQTLGGRDETTFMKLVVDAASDRVLGCHMVGADAGEIVQGLAIALKCGATKEQFDATVGIHPTSAEEFVTMREKVAPTA